MREKDGVEDDAAVVGNLITMRMRELLKDPMGSEHAESAADGSAAATPFVPRCSGSGEKQRLQVAVAQTVDGEFPTIDSQK